MLHAYEHRTANALGQIRQPKLPYFCGMKKQWLLILPIACLVMAVNISCKEASRDVNPNGSSELALFMRSMHENGMEVKQKLINGEKPEINYDCARLMTATPTEPAKVANPLYAGYAQAFEEKVKAFDQEYNSDPAGSYQSMVDACMNCHREICPGPMVKIKKMYLSDQELAELTSEE